MSGERVMPWYFAVSSGEVTHCYGVKTGARAFCFWQADPAGISLWLDVRNGGSGLHLGDRRLDAAEVAAQEGRPGATPFRAIQVFCRNLCDRPRLPEKPVYGSNNWYYLYGENMTAESVMSDVEQLASLAPLESEPVVTKGGVDALIGTPLVEMLLGNGIRQVVLAGVATNLAVEATARHATDIGLGVTVLEDCCASFKAELHAFAVENLFPMFSSVSTTDAYFA